MPVILYIYIIYVDYTHDVCEEAKNVKTLKFFDNDDNDEEIFFDNISRNQFFWSSKSEASMDAKKLYAFVNMYTFIDSNYLN